MGGRHQHHQCCICNKDRLAGSIGLRDHLRKMHGIYHAVFNDVTFFCPKLESYRADKTTFGEVIQVVPQALFEYKVRSGYNIWDWLAMRFQRPDLREQFKATMYKFMYEGKPDYSNEADGILLKHMPWLNP
jgi:hypothetical protein